MPTIANVRANMSAHMSAVFPDCIQPLSNTLVLICIATQFHAISLLLIPKVGAEIGLRAWGHRAYSKVPKKNARYVSVSDRTTVVGSGPGKSEA